MPREFTIAVTRLEMSLLVKIRIRGLSVHKSDRKRRRLRSNEPPRGEDEQRILLLEDVVSLLGNYFFAGCRKSRNKDATPNNDKRERESLSLE